MRKKFTRVVLTAVMPISMIVGCGNTEKTEVKEPKAIQSEEKGLYGLLIWKQRYSSKRKSERTSTIRGWIYG